MAGNDRERRERVHGLRERCGGLYLGVREVPPMSGDSRMVKLAELWERTSARGARYFSGFLGDAQVLLFDGGEKPHPTKPGEVVHVWRLMVQERDPSRRPQARDAGAPDKPSASPVARGDGWRGYRVPPARE